MDNQTQPIAGNDDPAVVKFERMICEHFGPNEVRKMRAELEAAGDRPTAPAGGVSAT